MGRAFLPLPLLTLIAALVAADAAAGDPQPWSIDRGGQPVPLDPAFVRQQPSAMEAPEAWAPSGLADPATTASLYLIPPLGAWYGSGPAPFLSPGLPYRFGWRPGVSAYAAPYLPSPYAAAGWRAGGWAGGGWSAGGWSAGGWSSGDWSGGGWSSGD